MQTVALPLCESWFSRCRKHNFQRWNRCFMWWLWCFYSSSAFGYAPFVVLSRLYAFLCIRTGICPVGMFYGLTMHVWKLWRN